MMLRLSLAAIVSAAVSAVPTEAADVVTTAAPTEPPFLAAAEADRDDAQRRANQTYNEAMQSEQWYRQHEADQNRVDQEVARIEAAVPNTTQHYERQRRQLLHEHERVMRRSARDEARNASAAAHAYMKAGIHLENAQRRAGLPERVYEHGWLRDELQSERWGEHAEGIGEESRDHIENFFDLVKDKLEQHRDEARDQQRDHQDNQQGDWNDDQQGNGQGDRQDSGRTDQQGDGQEDQQGNWQGDQQGDRQGDGQGNTQGDHQSDQQGHQQRNIQGDQQGNGRSDQQGNGQGDQQGDRQGHQQPNTQGDQQGNGQSDQQSNGQSDQQRNQQGNHQGNQQVNQQRGQQGGSDGPGTVRDGADSRSNLSAALNLRARAGSPDNGAYILTFAFMGFLASMAFASQMSDRRMNQQAREPLLGA